MSSIFTFQDELPRLQSPWSTPGNATPQSLLPPGSLDGAPQVVDDKSRLEPEKQDGPCEYKLHLLLRARRPFVSMTTAEVGPGTNIIRPANLTNLSTSGRVLSEPILHRSTYQPSPQSRQARLQQLTTQLLWRLQQSSPFHSSSNAELVLPVLPEATPRLGVPERPARLLPGLEESQGALYEIGVADDGALIGLVNEELEESLDNLRAMAASLGCVVDILRRVTVGSCVWMDSTDATTEPLTREDILYAAEVLVRPDTRASPAVHHARGDETTATVDEANHHAPVIEQLRVALIGPSTVGKSSLLGTLTTSSLDNGRGKSRLSLLKHRHEIASGITSSVAHELLGYNLEGDGSDFVVNYSTGDVSTWTDIHELSDRLCFAIDSPGLSKFAKSTFRALVSWRPDWTCVCIAADDSELGLTSQPTQNDALGETPLSHIELCLRLRLNFVVVITKMDLATKTRLRTVLAKILTCLKNAGKKPLILSTASAVVPSFALDSAEALPDLQRATPEERAEIDRLANTLHNDVDSQSVPIVMTSTVSGAGVGKLHRLLSQLPLESVPLPSSDISETHATTFHVDEVFSIPPVRIYAEFDLDSTSTLGVVLCGRISHGTIQIGDKMFLGPFPSAEPAETALTRSKSESWQDLRRLSLFNGHTPNGHVHGAAIHKQSCFAPVKVVSLRNLRLPVHRLSQAGIGTIGVEALDPQSFPLQKARKGMLLTPTDLSHFSCHGLVARFPARDFLVASPPLILGGHATVYFNSVRAAVKVIALALVEDTSTDASATPEMFSFDVEEVESDENINRFVHISLRFVNSVECIQRADQVLVVPTFSAAGPRAGPVAVTNGLMGFVGLVVEALP